MTLDPEQSFGLFERIVQTLSLSEAPKLSPESLSLDAAVFSTGRNDFAPRRVAVVRFKSEAPEETDAQLSELVPRLRSTPFDVILVGGPKDARRLLKKQRKIFSTHGQGFLHLPADGSAWSSNASFAKKRLDQVIRAPERIEYQASVWRDLRESLQANQHQRRIELAELAPFAQVMAKRTPVVTWSIAALIVLVFVAELLLGGPDVAPVLVRLGALTPDRVRAGEWWRLLACTFVHGGWLHVVFNLYVLIVLGDFLERIIGPARFLVLYVLSAIGGSLASFWMLDASMSVGASGAVWGLLGAHAVLAFRNDGLLPASLIPGARKAALINLVINVLNSFRPNVDMWAHFAGGAVGAILLTVGGLRRGLPTAESYGAPSEPSSAESDGGWSRVPTSGALWGASGLAGLVLLSGLAGALIDAHPFALKAPVQLSMVELEGLGLSVAIPEGLEANVDHDRADPKTKFEVEGEPSGASFGTTDGTANETASETASFGSPLSDPMVVELLSVPIPELDDESLAAQVEDLRKTLEPPKGGKVKERPTIRARRGDNASMLVASYELPESAGLIYERVFVFRSPRMVRVDVLRWPAFPSAAPAGIAQQIAETIAVR